MRESSRVQGFMMVLELLRVRGFPMVRELLMLRGFPILVREEDMVMEEAVAEVEEVVHAAKVFDKVPAAKVFDNMTVTGAELADTRGLSKMIAKGVKVASHKVCEVGNMNGAHEDNVYGHGNVDRCVTYFDTICRGNIDDYNRWVLTLDKAVMVGEIVVGEEILPVTQVIVQVPDRENEAVAAGVEVEASGSGTRNVGINAGIEASKKVSLGDMAEEDFESEESSMSSQGGWTEVQKRKPRAVSLSRE